MNKELEKLIKNCQEYGGLNRCFLNDELDIRCEYMGKEIRSLEKDKAGIERLNVYHQCQKRKDHVGELKGLFKIIGWKYERINK